jgi:hypothetical protein
LMQTGKPDKEVAGSVSLNITGLMHSKPLTLILSQVTPNRRIALSYSFRYFQEYDELVDLPPGFEATRVEIEIHSGKDVSHGFRQAFVWKAQGMSVETEAAGESSGSVPGKGDANVQTE